MPTMTLERARAEVLEEPVSHWSETDFTIRAPERADCCPTAAAVVLSVKVVDGIAVPLRFCGHHATKFERAGADFGRIMVDDRDKLDVKPGASA
ncbi:DUF7455 domain-containing protein [Pseudactinotalea terrae]|uniref:DUF7455 domain-containing protein n=1 Tax=Pseudactinotalea terrae TaxID=1743262 RepID=UPI0012E0FE3C|nr:hypothetical protein [Pseudactinotalea terrae]